MARFNQPIQSPGAYRISILASFAVVAGICACGSNNDASTARVAASEDSKTGSGERQNEPLASAAVPRFSDPAPPKLNKLDSIAPPKPKPYSRVTFHAKPKPLPEGWRPNDIGYTTMGLHVADFDARLAHLAASGVHPLTDPIGASPSRRVCIRDPEGVLLELMEDDPRMPSAPARPFG